jgi:hypothetical protein
MITQYWKVLEECTFVISDTSNCFHFYFIFICPGLFGVGHSSAEHPFGNLDDYSSI